MFYVHIVMMIKCVLIAVQMMLEKKFYHQQCSVNVGLQIITLIERWILLGIYFAVKVTAFVQNNNIA